MKTSNNKFSLRNKGQAMLESVMVFVILLVMVFGAMDFARLSWTLLHYQGIAQAAVRAEVVGKSGNSSANVLCLALFGLNLSPGGKTYVKTAVDSSINSKAKKHNFLIALGPILPADKTKVETVKSTAYFHYSPIFPFGAWKIAGTLLWVDYFMPREAPVGSPW